MTYQYVHIINLKLDFTTAILPATSFLGQRENYIKMNNKSLKEIRAKTLLLSILYFFFLS